MAASRSRGEIGKRYLFMILGLLFNAFGVVLLTKSSLGTSPIASIPYVLSEYFPISMGTLNFALYFLFFVVQLLILRKKMTASDWMQIPLSMCYSVFLDLYISLAAAYQPKEYGVMLGGLLLGCIFRSLGISMQVVADVAMLSGEAFVLVLAKALKKEYSIVKLVSDALMVIIAVVLSYVLLGDVIGVREGTLIVVLLVAPLSNSMTEALFPIGNRLFKGKAEVLPGKEISVKEGAPLIITISSQSGSGGHRIGKLVAEKLGMKLYDNSIIDMIAKEGGFEPEYVRDRMVGLYTNRFWEFFVENYSQVSYQMDNYEAIYEAQERVMEKLAAEGNCVIVGYCSEYLLKERENVFSVHIHANEEAKLKFLEQEYKVTSRRAKEIMLSHDRERARYFNHFTGEDWSETGRFSLSLDSSLFGLDGTADIICNVIGKII